MRSLIGFGVAAVVSASTAQAQDWTAEAAGDVRTAVVVNDDATLRVNCLSLDAPAPNSIEVTIGDSVIAGPVTFAFGNGTSVAGIFQANTLLADTPENQAVFVLIRDLLKSQNAVAVIARGAEEREFALRGSRNAIGDCEVAPVVATAPAAEVPAEAPPASEDTPSEDVAQVAPVARPTPSDNMTTLAPIANDPFTDHRIASCAGTRGLLLMNYDTLNGVTELSDFCFDESAGTLTASESRGGFTLVDDSDTGKAFEILDTGDDRYSRVRIGFGQDLGCGNAIAQASVDYAIPDGVLTRNPETLFLYARGFTVPDTALTAQDLMGTEAVLLSIRDFSVKRISPATTETALLPEGADMRGVLTADGQSGALTITGGNGFWVGEAGGAIDLTADEDGDVTGAGQFSAQNQRLVGQKAHDWVTMTAEIPYLRGYNLGEALIGYGVVRGSYVDARDRTHQFEASATLTACTGG